MRGIRNVACLVLALVPAVLFAAPPEVPAVLKAKPGQLVRITVKGEAELGTLKNFKDEEAFWGELVSPKGQRQFVFQAPAVEYDKDGKPLPARTQFVVGWWAKGEIEGASTTIVIEGVAPVPPTPVPPGPTPVPPVPQPDGKFGLTKASRDAAALVVSTTKPAESRLLASATRGVASAIAAGGLPDPAASDANALKALDEWSAAIRTALFNEAPRMTAWKAWSGPTSKAFFAAYDAKQLKTKADWVDAFNAIADGLAP